MGASTSILLKKRGEKLKLRTYVHAIVWSWRHITGQYIVRDLDFLRQFIDENSICFDIGAHAGSWAIPLAQITKQGQVYAFEALPYYAEVLTSTLKILHSARITIVNKAITDNCGHASVIFEDMHGQKLTGLTHIAREKEYIHNAAVVEAITLDEFYSQTNLKDKIRFIKCDVEGAEMLVLNGAEKLIENMRPVFYCEVDQDLYCKYGYSIEDLFNFWNMRDYNAYVLNNMYKWESITVNNTRKGNCLFLPAEINLF